MQNLPQKSVDLLSHINQEIGIDITKYKNDEIIGKVTSLITIQNFAASLFKPLIFSFIIFILGFFILKLELIGYIVYGFFGFILFALIGVFYGIIKMFSTLKKDLLPITKYALDTTNYIISDGNQLNDNVRYNIKNPVGLIFEGALAAFVTPTISEKYNRIPLAGNIMISGTDKVLKTVVHHFKKQEDSFDIKNRIVDTNHAPADKSAMVKNFILAFSLNNTDRLLNSGFRTIQHPFKIALVCLVSGTLIFMACVSIF